MVLDISATAAVMTKLLIFEHFLFTDTRAAIDLSQVRRHIELNANENVVVKDKTYIGTLVHTIWRS